MLIIRNHVRFYFDSLYLPERFNIFEIIIYYNKHLKFHYLLFITINNNLLHTLNFKNVTKTLKYNINDMLMNISIKLNYCSKQEVLGRK